MSERIRILDRNAPAIVIFEAMVKKAAEGDLLEHFTIQPNGDDTVANVEMTVNGESVPIMETLLSYFNQFDSDVEGRAKEMALEMTTSLGLEKIRDQMQSLEQNTMQQQGAIESAIIEWAAKRA